MPWMTKWTGQLPFSGREHGLRLPLVRRTRFLNCLNESMPYIASLYFRSFLGNGGHSELCQRGCGMAKLSAYLVYPSLRGMKGNSINMTWLRLMVEHDAQQCTCSPTTPAITSYCQTKGSFFISRTSCFE